MKVLHLICNSHIDPVWQWDWDEGASTCLSTFYAACNLLDKYDFIFCHNEVIVYEYIERYDPELFKRIQLLVAQGKWKIMGGWYCQPDCFVPSGESFLRQISLGREYFQDKFNSRPTTALNFDSFGHSKGLVQILNKCGYDSYIFCRPLPNYVYLPNFVDYPHGPFLWEGFDGSKIKALRYEDQYYNYTTPYGYAVYAIKQKVSQYEDLDIVPILWGVGNHGGTSSEKDLEDIIELQNEKKGEWKIIHSTLEEYFATANPTNVEKRNIYVFLKSYSSVNAIKLAHDQLENALYFTEKVCSIAGIQNKYIYNKEILKNAERTLCQIEFHDVLSGTAIERGTLSSVRKAYRAIEDLKGEMFAAFNSMAKDLNKVAVGDENNVFFNPYPYEYRGYLELEIYPPIFVNDKNEYGITLYDEENKEIPFQIIKEESNIRFQHRVRLIFNGKIPAYSVKSYGVHIELVPIKEKVINSYNEIVVSDKNKTIKISKETGLIESFIVDGKEYASSNMCVPVTFDDNEDPWGWRFYNLTDNQFNEYSWPLKEQKSTLKNFKLDKELKGPFKNLESVSVIEDGEFLTEVQSLFKKDTSYVAIIYRIYHDTKYIDINVKSIWNEQRKGLKLKFPINSTSKYFAQAAYGVDVYPNNGYEFPMNRYVGVPNGEEALVIYNRSGIHSVSRKGKNLYLTLLNGACWCAHPTSDQVSLTDPDKYIPSVEQGTHSFQFRMMVNKIEECEKYSNEFNEPIYNVIYYPHGKGNVENASVVLSNSNIVIKAFKRRNDGTYLIRLYNGFSKKSSTELQINGISKTISFSKYSFKTFVYDGSKIVESKDSSIY